MFFIAVYVLCVPLAYIAEHEGERPQSITSCSVLPIAPLSSRLVIRLVGLVTWGKPRKMSHSLPRST